MDDRKSSITAQLSKSYNMQPAWHSACKFTSNNSVLALGGLVTCSDTSSNSVEINTFLIAWDFCHKRKGMALQTGGLFAEILQPITFLQPIIRIDFPFKHTYAEPILQPCIFNKSPTFQIYRGAFLIS